MSPTPDPRAPLPPPATPAGQATHAELRELRATIAALRLALDTAPDAIVLEATVQRLLEHAPATPPQDTKGVRLLFDIVRVDPQLNWTVAHG